MTLTQIFSVNRPVRLVTAGDGPTLLVNRDITNAVLYGGQDIASGNANKYSVLDPLGSITVDGTEDVYAIPNSGTPTVDVVIGASSWTPSPASVAAQINALGLARDTSVQATNAALGTPAQDSTVAGVNTTLFFGTNPSIQGLTVGGNPGGIPVLRGTANLGFGAGTTLAGSGVASLLTTVAVSKPSFEAILQLRMPAASGLVPFAALAVNWTDSNTGLVVGFKQYILSCGNGAGNDLIFYLSGPCRGNQISVTLTNLDTTQTITYTWAFNVTSHVYTIDRLLQPTYPATAPNGFTFGAGNPSKGLLFASQPSIGPLGQIQRLTAACNAKAKLNIDNGAQLNGCAVLLVDPINLYNSAVTNQTLNGLVAPAGARVNSEIQFPNGPFLLLLINQAATNTIQPSITITAMEY